MYHQYWSSTLKGVITARSYPSRILFFKPEGKNAYYIILSPGFLDMSNNI